MFYSRAHLRNHFSPNSLAISLFGNDHRTTEQRNLPILHKKQISIFVCDM